MTFEKMADLLTLPDLHDSIDAKVTTNAPLKENTGARVNELLNDMADTLWNHGTGAEWGEITGTLSDQTDLQSALDALKVEVFSGVVKYAANATYTIDTSAAFGYTVDSIIIESDSGTVTAALKIGATAITGISAVSVTTSAATGTATAANVVSVGNRLVLVLSSNADARKVKYTIKYTRS